MNGYRRLLLATLTACLLALGCALLRGGAGSSSAPIRGGAATLPTVTADAAGPTGRLGTHGRTEAPRGPAATGGSSTPHRRADATAASAVGGTGDPLDEGGRAVGRILGPYGAPIAGAAVAVESSNADPVAALAGAASPPSTAVTDPQGHFILTGVPAGVFRIGASADGHVANRSGPFRMARGARVLCGTLTLSRGHRLAGVIFGTSGQPLAGIAVELTESHHDARQRVAGGGPGEAPPRAPRTRGPTLGRCVAVTDARGQFELNGLPPGPLRLEARSPGYSTETIDPLRPGATPNVRLVVSARRTLTGVIVDGSTGAPIEHFGLHARRVDEHDLSATPRETLSPTPHESGRFVVAGLAAGAHRLDVDAPGYTPIAFGPIQVPHDRDPPPVTVRLERGIAVRGHVVTRASGTPVSHARAELHFDGARVAAARTDRDGRFVLRTQRPGSYRLVVAGIGYVASVDHVRLRRGAAPQIDVALAPEEAPAADTAGSILGHARIAGAPAAAIEVSVRRADETKRTHRVRTGADGAFRIGALAAGDYILRVRAGAAPILSLPITLAHNQQLRHDLDLLVGTLRLDVRDARGEPVASGVVHLEPTRGAAPQPTTGWSPHRDDRRAVVRDGSATLTHLPAGRWIYAIRTDGLEPCTGSVTIAPRADPQHHVVRVQDAESPAARRP
ncbi:MAG: carboxypeptidase-like regulatory domain-containing protein [Planctomycetota bacterium]